MQKTLFLLLSFTTVSISMERKKYDRIPTTQQEKKRLERKCPMPKFIQKLIRRKETDNLSPEDIRERYGASE